MHHDRRRRRDVRHHSVAVEISRPLSPLRNDFRRAYTRHMPRSRPNESRVTIADYLSAEERRAFRHEYIRGEVYAMSGGTMRHSQIAANIIRYLGTAARGTRCRVFTSDFKVQPSDEAVYYPDASVVCGPLDGSAVVTEGPCLVVEVTSRGTARVDRGEKLEQYLKCATLETYLIVDQSRKRVTRHWREGAGEWRSEDIVGEGSIPLPCPRFDLTLDQIYEDVELPLQVGEPKFAQEEDEYPVEV